MTATTRFLGLPLALLLIICATPAKGADTWSAPVHDRPVIAHLLAEVLEYRRGAEEGDTLHWDAFGWLGGDYHRLWVKTEGEHGFDGGSSGETDVQLLYGRLIAPYWDLQVGVRQEWRYGKSDDRTRTSAVIGVQGLAPYWFELEPSLFVSERGDVSARITADYDLLLTQRLILQPRIEAELAAQDVEEWGIAQGINNIEAGLRLRYEIHRKFAPYVGFSWRRDVGETARLTRKAGDDVEEVSFVAGVRIWF